MNEKELKEKYNSIIQECEKEIALAALQNKCMRCEKTFEDPKEFKMLRNPITGETKRSILCNACRPIVLEEFKKTFMKERT